MNSGFSADAVPCIVFATVLAAAEDSVFKVTAVYELPVGRNSHAKWWAGLWIGH